MSVKCFVNFEEINDTVIPLPSLVLRVYGGSVGQGGIWSSPSLCFVVPQNMHRIQQTTEDGDGG